jgi:light-regulated signal transduction histidine kinase (bacteriophytochrome)
MNDVTGTFKHEDIDVCFSYRRRKIVSTSIEDQPVWVEQKLFNRIFSAMQRRCGEERRNQTGPFWGPGGPCYREATR